MLLHYFNCWMDYSFIYVVLYFLYSPPLLSDFKDDPFFIKPAFMSSHNFSRCTCILILKWCLDYTSLDEAWCYLDNLEGIWAYLILLHKHTARLISLSGSLAHLSVNFMLIYSFSTQHRSRGAQRKLLWIGTNMILHYI